MRLWSVAVLLALACPIAGRADPILPQSHPDAILPVRPRDRDALLDWIKRYSEVRNAVADPEAGLLPALNQLQASKTDAERNAILGQMQIIVKASRVHAQNALDAVQSLAPLPADVDARLPIKSEYIRRLAIASLRARLTGFDILEKVLNGGSDAQTALEQSLPVLVDQQAARLESQAALERAQADVFTKAGIARYTLTSNALKHEAWAALLRLTSNTAHENYNWEAGALGASEAAKSAARQLPVMLKLLAPDRAPYYRRRVQIIGEIADVLRVIADRRPSNKESATRCLLFLAPLEVEERELSGLLKTPLHS